MLEYGPNDWDLQEPEDFAFFQDQLEGIEFLIQYPRSILADEMGMGKCLVLLCALKHFKPKRILILGTKNSTYTWRKEINKWMPGLSQYVTLVRGQPLPRKKKWKQFYEGGIAICTYGSIKQDLLLAKDIAWDAIILDEFHKSGLRNRKTDTHQKMYDLIHKATKVPDQIWPTSGSPASRGVQDLWGVFKVLNPKWFPSYWKYITRYCIIENDGFGNVIIGQQNMKEFRDVTKTMLLRRKKADVRPDMVKKYRDVVPIDASPYQLKQYKKLAAHMLTELTDGSYKIASTVLALQTRLRQLLVCPKLIDPDCDDYGAGIEWIMEHIDDNEIDKAVIFTPFPAAFPFLKEYIQAKNFRIMELRGGMEPEDIEKVVNALDESIPTIVLVSIHFAESYDLVQCKAAYFLGRDFDPEINYQAEDRLHRSNSKHDVNMYYPFIELPAESEQFDILNNKVRDVRQLYNDVDILKKILGLPTNSP